jgi:hypothetical protein
VPDQDGAADSVIRLGDGASGDVSVPGDELDGEQAAKVAPRATMSNRRLSMVVLQG